MVQSTIMCERSVCTYMPSKTPKGLLFMCIDKPGTLARSLEYIEKYTGKEYGLACICVQPKNAYDEYTPWPAPSIYSGQAPFTGKTDEYLKDVTETIIPWFCKENGLDFPAEKRGIVGYSLGGAAALYSFMKQGFFGHLGMCSGSVWYPGLIDRLKECALPITSGCVYLSMGDREQTDFLKEFSNLNRQVKEIKTIFERKLDNPTCVKFEWSSGEHGDNIPARLAQAMFYLESEM